MAALALLARSYPERAAGRNDALERRDQAWLRRPALLSRLRFKLGGSITTS